jgi:uncharacterized membrane protein YozB (DUF420 family)
MATGPAIILTLKLLVSAVTVLFAAALGALAGGNGKLHGRLNTLFFALTMLTVLGFELALRLGTDVTAQFSPAARQALRIHLFFAVPAAVVLPIMFISAIKKRRRFHAGLGLVFVILWLGTFITGVIFLPHE